MLKQRIELDQKDTHSSSNISGIVRSNLAQAMAQTHQSAQVSYYFQILTLNSCFFISSFLFLIDLLLIFYFYSNSFLFFFNLALAILVT